MNDETLFVIVDFQNDFVSGSLAVPNAEDTIDAIIRVGRAVEMAGGYVVLSRDWHPADHSSFAEWPPHCVQNTWGAEFHPRIREAFPGALVFSKGQDVDAEQYSAYLATSSDGMTLQEFAIEVGKIEYVVVAGLALDYCVRETTFDFWTGSWPTTLVLDGTRPVTFETGARVLLDMGHYDQGELYAYTADEVIERVLGP